MLSLFAMLIFFCDTFFCDSIMWKHAKIITNSESIVVEFIFSYTHFAQNLDFELIIDTKHMRKL